MAPWDCSSPGNPWQLFAQRALSSTAEQCTTSGEDTTQTDTAPWVSTMWDTLHHKLAQRGAPFAAVSSAAGPKKKKAPRKADATPAAEDGQPKDIREVMKQRVAGLSLEQQERLRNLILVEKLKKRRVRVDGKRTNLYKLAKEVIHEQKLAEVGAGEPQIRQEPRWLADESIPGQNMRPWAYKMQLRPHEQAALPLDLFARGQSFSPHPVLRYLLGGRRDFAFGIYGKADAARELLHDEYAGLPRDDVILRQDFYEDVLDHANELELTLMAVTARPLPLAPLRDSLVERVRLGMRQSAEHPAYITEAPPPPEDDAELEFLRSSITEEALRPYNVLDKKGNIRTGTHLILATRPNAGLLVEAISPDTLRDRKACMAGPFKSALLTRAAMGLALGPFPVDLQAKVQAGQAILYVTNGFKLAYDPDNERQVFSDWDNRPEFPVPRTEELEPSPDLFMLEGAGARPPSLLRNIQRRRAPAQ